MPHERRILPWGLPHYQREAWYEEKGIIYIMIETAQNLEVGNNLGLLYQIYRFWVGKKI